MNIGGGAGIELRGRWIGGRGRKSYACARGTGFASRDGRGGHRHTSIFAARIDGYFKSISPFVGLRDVFGCGGQFEGTGEVGADPGGFLGGGDHPLIEGAADGAALE